MDESAKNPESDSSNIVANLVELIKNHIQRIDKLKNEVKTANSILDEHLIADPVYREHSEKAKEAAKIRSNTRKQILAKPELFSVSQKIKELKAELKELQNGLSDYLHEYQRLSGASEITDNEGGVREIIMVAKLIKKPQKNK